MDVFLFRGRCPNNVSAVSSALFSAGLFRMGQVILGAPRFVQHLSLTALDGSLGSTLKGCPRATVWAPCNVDWYRPAFSLTICSDSDGFTAIPPDLEVMLNKRDLAGYQPF